MNYTVHNPKTRAIVSEHATIEEARAAIRGTRHYIQYPQDAIDAENAARKHGTTTVDGRTYYLTGEADYTNRRLPAGYTDLSDARDGEEYQFEMSAPAIDAAGGTYHVYWIFGAIAGVHHEADAYDYRVADRVEPV